MPSTVLGDRDIVFPEPIVLARSSGVTLTALCAGTHPTAAGLLSGFHISHLPCELLGTWRILSQHPQYPAQSTQHQEGPRSICPNRVQSALLGKQGFLISRDDQGHYKLEGSARLNARSIS